MITLKHILVPTDFGETARLALKYAQELAKTFNASIHLLHVLNDPLTYPAAHEGYFSLQPDYRQVMEQETYQRLETLLPEGERAAVHAKCVVRWGSPFVEIVRYAKSENMDMIVMGSHGLGPIAHMLMGSVAEKVVRKAPCPVLTVRHPEHEFVMP